LFAVTATDRLTRDRTTTLTGIFPKYGSCRSAECTTEDRTDLTAHFITHRSTGRTTHGTANRTATSRIICTSGQKNHKNKTQFLHIYFSLVFTTTALMTPFAAITTVITVVATIMLVLMPAPFMITPVITVSVISLTGRRIVLAATDRSTRTATDRRTDNGTVFAAHTLTDRSTGRTTQRTAKYCTTINCKSAGTHKKQRSNY
jgi:hypothetical protein